MSDFVLPNVDIEFKNFTKPLIKDLIDDNEGLKFTLYNTNLSFANAIRRTILSDIDVCCILSEFNETNQVDIEVNTGRLHNEILKQRLSCIPVHFSGNHEEMTAFCNDHILKVECHNDSDILKFVTTKDFHVFNKETNQEIDTKTLFPPNLISMDFIDFARLRPKISDSIPGESLKLTAGFSISNAHFNSMYNVVSKCVFYNTIDIKLAESKWMELKNNYKDKKLSDDAIEFERKNFYILDAQRSFITDSFDFHIQGLNIFDNRHILKTSCSIIIDKFIQLITDIQNDSLIIHNSESTVRNSFDIILTNEDYTIGKILEFILYQYFFLNFPILSFCGFKKFHPHDKQSTIRIAFINEKHISLSKHILTFSSQFAILILKHITDKFI